MSIKTTNQSNCSCWPTLQPADFETSSANRRCSSSDCCCRFSECRWRSCCSLRQKNRQTEEEARLSCGQLWPPHFRCPPNQSTATCCAATTSRQTPTHSPRAETAAIQAATRRAQRAALRCWCPPSPSQANRLRAEPLAILTRRWRPRDRREALLPLAPRLPATAI